MQTRGRARHANLSMSSKAILGTATTVLYSGQRMRHTPFQLRQENARPDWSSADGQIPIRGLGQAGAAGTHAASATELSASAARRASQATFLQAW
jgi:hypothetical protein